MLIYPKLLELLFLNSYFKLSLKIIIIIPCFTNASYHSFKIFTGVRHVLSHITSTNVERSPEQGEKNTKKYKVRQIDFYFVTSVFL